MANILIVRDLGDIITVTVNGSPVGGINLAMNAVYQIARENNIPRTILVDALFSMLVKLDQGDE